jgi:hypothetical protein
LRALPRDFRARYRSELIDLFDRRVEEASRSSRLVGLKRAWREVLDVLAVAYRLRREVPRSAVEGRARRLHRRRPR